MAPVQLHALGDCAVLAGFGDGIDEEVNARVLATAARLREAAHPAILDIVPAVATLAVHVNPRVLPLEACARLVEAAAREVRGSATVAVRPDVVEIPVCYDAAFAPDLADVARWAACTVDDVVAWHAAPTYRVFMLGFLPGFPYLGTVDSRIAVPRRPTPRARVEAGSVGIAGAQTGVYPRPSPGGWHIIGRTPIVLFEPAAVPPALLAAGGLVRFVPIDRARYDVLHAEAAR